MCPLASDLPVKCKPEIVLGSWWGMLREPEGPCTKAGATGEDYLKAQMTGT